MPRPTTWSVVSPQLTEISTPGTQWRPWARAAAAASSSPSVLSWSVSAIASVPVRAASSISWVGESKPSERVEWLCRSKFSKCASAKVARNYIKINALTPGIRMRPIEFVDDGRAATRELVARFEEAARDWEERALGADLPGLRSRVTVLEAIDRQYGGHAELALEGADE